MKFPGWMRTPKWILMMIAWIEKHPGTTQLLGIIVAAFVGIWAILATVNVRIVEMPPPSSPTAVILQPVPATSTSIASSGSSTPNPNLTAITIPVSATPAPVATLAISPTVTNTPSLLLQVEDILGIELTHDSEYTLYVFLNFFEESLFEYPQLPLAQHIYNSLFDANSHHVAISWDIAQNNVDPIRLEGEVKQVIINHENNIGYIANINVENMGEVFDVKLVFWDDMVYYKRFDNSDGRISPWVGLTTEQALILLGLFIDVDFGGLPMNGTDMVVMLGLGAQFGRIPWDQAVHGSIFLNLIAVLETYTDLLTINDLELICNNYYIYQETMERSSQSASPLYFDPEMALDQLGRGLAALDGEYDFNFIRDTSANSAQSSDTDLNWRRLDILLSNFYEEAYGTENAHNIPDIIMTYGSEGEGSETQLRMVYIEFLNEGSQTSMMSIELSENTDENLEEIEIESPYFPCEDN